MKKYKAKLDRESITFDYGYKQANINQGEIYGESEIISLFPKYFEEIPQDSSTNDEVGLN